MGHWLRELVIFAQDADSVPGTQTITTIYNSISKEFDSFYECYGTPHTQWVHTHTRYVNIHTHV